MDLTAQDLWILRNIIIRAVKESHDVLAAAARRPKPGQAERQTPAPPQVAPPPPPARAQTPKLLYSLKDAATALGVSRSTVYNLINAGDLPTVKIGERRLIQPAEVEAFLSRAQPRP